MPDRRERLVRDLLRSSDPARARALIRNAPDLADSRAALLLLDGFNRHVRARRPYAVAAVTAAEALAAVSRDRVPRAVADRIAGVAAHLEGRSRTAIRRLVRASRGFESSGRLLEAGDTERILIDALMLSERDATARRAARRARSLYARAGGVDARRLGSLEMNLGNLYHRRDEHERALEAYDRARALLRRTRDPFRMANVDFNRANILSSLDRTERARKLYESARDVFELHGRAALAAQASNALAVLDLEEGRLDAALDRLHELRGRLDALGDRVGAAHCDLDYAEAYARLNRPVEAEVAVRRAEAFFRRAGYRAETALCLGVRGGIEQQFGHPGLASRLFARGAALQRELRNPVGAATLDIGHAHAELRRGHADPALARARAAARLLERRGLRSRAGRAHAVAAEAATRAGRTKLGRGAGHKALRLARAAGDVRVQLAAHMALARAERQAGSDAAAYRHLLAAERCVERMRPGVTGEESRLAFAADKSEVYEELVLDRLSRGGRRATLEALRFAERGKARALAERLALARTSLLGGSTPGVRRLVERLRDVDRRLALAEARLDQGRDGIRSARRRRRAELCERRAEVIHRIRRFDPARAMLLGAPMPDPREAIGKLADDEVVLEYTEARGAFHLFVVENRGVRAYANLADASQVARAGESLRFQLGKGVLGCDHASRFASWIREAIRADLARLYDLLLDPVGSGLDGRRVRIVPHGLLHGLPFHAFEREGRALVERCTPSYVPSLTSLLMLGARRGNDPLAAPVLLGAADARAPLIDREVDAVRRHVPNARVYRGGAATQALLERTGERPSLLHVACHGFYGSDGPWDAGLRLGDSWFSVADLYGLDATAELVVLSGCETGKGTVYSGDEWVGLVRGFLQAGARTVVASLWEVQDRGTYALMDDFYARLSRGATVAEAMAAAQREALGRDPLPLHWAPFHVIGEADLRIRTARAA